MHASQAVSESCETWAASRRGVLLGLAAAAAAPLAGCSASGQKPGEAKRIEDVVLGVSTYRGNFTDFFWQVGGAGPRYRIDFATLPFDMSLQSVNNGTLDIGTNFTDIPLGIWAGNIRNARIIAVQRASGHDQYLELLVPAGSKARSVADLRGKRIGFLRASSHHYFLLNTLAEHGLANSDVEMISLPRDMLQPAFASGQLDATVAINVDAIMFEDKLAARTLHRADNSYSGNVVVVANREAMDDPIRSAAIIDFLQRSQRALRWMQDHPEEWAESVSARTHLPPSYYLKLARWRRNPITLSPIAPVDLSNQRKAIDKFISAGYMKPVDLAPLWDPRFSSVL